MGALASHQPQAFRRLWPPFPSITLMILLSWSLSWINLGSALGPEILEEPGCSYSHSSYLCEQKHGCLNTVNVVPSHSSPPAARHLRAFSRLPAVYTPKSLYTLTFAHSQTLWGSPHMDGCYHPSHSPLPVQRKT